MSDYFNWKMHFIFNFTLIVTLLICFPYWNNKEIWGDQLIFIIYIQRIAYMIATGVIIHQYCGLFIPRNIEMKKVSRWLSSILIGKVLIFSAYIITFSGYGSIVQVFIIFSFFLYVLFFLLLLSSNARNEIILQPSPKYGGRKIEDQTTFNVLEKLNQLLISQELYRIPDLKIKDVAEKLNTSPHQLSQIINQNLNKNFKQFINEYRIEKAKNLIQHNQQFTLEAIGYECGFKSKSNFFSTFKKITGDTPKAYQKTFSKLSKN